MLNHQGHIDAMDHAAGGVPDTGQTTPRLTLLTLYNQAGRALFTEHPWNWRVVGPGPAPLEAVAAQEFVELPAAFGNPVAITVRGNAGFRVIQTTLQQLMEMRQGQAGFVGGGCYVSFEGNSPPLANGPAGPRRMFIYPTPTAAALPSFDLVFEQKWVEAVEGRLDLFPNIPPEYEAALMFKGRALARNLVRQASTIEEGMYVQEIARLKAEDGRRQVDFGPLRGGADDWAQSARVSVVSGVTFSNASGA